MKLIRNSGNERVIDRLREWLGQGASVDLMSPTFSVHAFAEVRELIEKAEKCRLLLGDEAALADSLFGGAADIVSRGQLQGRWLARLAADWIKKRAEVRCAPSAPPQSLIVVQGAETRRALLGTCSFTTEGLGITPGGHLGLVQASDENDEAAAFAASWNGTVRWTAKSSIRLGHERKNWFVGVHPMPSPDPTFALDAKDVRFEAMRAGGPGGQHQNKTESAIRAIHVPTGLTAEARDGRSQHRNKARALERLREVLAAREDARLNAGRHREWLSRIAVSRGNPVRIYEGNDFKRKA